MPARKIIQEEIVSETPKCDNHPGRKAVITTTSKGSHSEISLCDECMPARWKDRVEYNAV
jgi:hypothetical protein